MSFDLKSYTLRLVRKTTPAPESTEKLSLSVPDVYFVLTERVVRGGEQYNCCSPTRGVKDLLSSESITQLQINGGLAEILDMETDQLRWGD